MALATARNNKGDSPGYSCGTRTGTRTAADFSVALGFAPRAVRVVNLTDRVEATHYIESALDGGSNAKSLLTIATGVRTYVDAGVAVANNTLTVTVATAGLETDDDDVFWEAWA